ncbi:MAG: hypothetical protein WC413_01990 [Candidatus Nanoarchaeia archaeon]
MKTNSKYSNYIEMLKDYKKFLEEMVTKYNSKIKTPQNWESKDYENYEKKNIEIADIEIGLGLSVKEIEDYWKKYAHIKQPYQKPEIIKDIYNTLSIKQKQNLSQNFKKQIKKLEEEIIIELEQEKQ